MRRILISIVIFMSLVLTNCSQKEDQNVSADNTHINIKKPSIDINTSGPQPQILVGKEKFEKFLTYVEKNGKIPDGMGPCARTYSFFDENKNKYMMTTIKIGKNGEDSMNGSVKKISVFLFNKGIVDNEHSFHFYISTEGISFNSVKDTEIIENCYKFLLSKI